MMWWQRARVANDGPGSWHSEPLRLNIDDLTDVVRAAEQDFAGGIVEVWIMSPTHHPGESGRQIASQELASISPADARQLRIHAKTEDPESGAMARFLTIDFTGHGVRAGCGAGPGFPPAPPGVAFERAESIVRSARRGHLPGGSRGDVLSGAMTLDRVLNVGAQTLLVALLMWSAWIWRSLPVILLLGLLLCFTRPTVRQWSRNQGHRWDDSSSRWWLDLKSRAELRTERANRHRDLWVAILGIVTGVVGMFITNALGLTGN